jgi:hypothetical protein
LSEVTGNGGSVTWTASSGNTCGSGGSDQTFKAYLICVGSGVYQSLAGAPQYIINNNVTKGVQTLTCPATAAPVYAFTAVATVGGFGPPANYPSWSGSTSSSTGNTGLGVTNPVDGASTYQVTEQCVGSGGTITTLNRTEAAGGTGGFVVPSCSAAGDGNYAESISVSACPGGLAACQVVFSYSTPDTPSQPLCAPASGNVCYWQIQINGTPCVVGNAACASWWPTYQASPSTSGVTCLWGTYSMPVPDCQFLEYAYTAPGGDPTTGTQVGSSTATAPDTGGEASPNAAANPSVDTSSNQAQCYPSGWAAFNPVEWVLKPVECALVWAFEPDASTLTAAQTTLGGDLTAAGPGPLFAAMGTLIGSLNGVGGSGCQGPAVTFDIETVNQTIYPWDACDPPMSTVAALVYDLATVLVVVAGGLAFIRSLAAGFGFNFSMTGDSDTKYWNGETFK